MNLYTVNRADGLKNPILNVATYQCHGAFWCTVFLTEEQAEEVRAAGLRCTKD